MNNSEFLKKLEKNSNGVFQVRQKPKKTVNTQTNGENPPIERGFDPVEYVVGEGEEKTIPFWIPFSDTIPINLNFKIPAIKIYDVISGIRQLTGYDARVNTGCRNVNLGGKKIFSGVPCNLPQIKWCNRRVCHRFLKSCRSCKRVFGRSWCWHYPCCCGEHCWTHWYPCGYKQATTGQISLVKSTAKAKLLYQTPELIFHFKAQLKISGIMKIELGTTLPIEQLMDYLRDFDESVYDAISGEDAIEPEDVLQNILNKGKDVNWFIDFAKFAVQIKAGALFIRITELKIKTQFIIERLLIKLGNRNLLYLNNLELNEQEVDLLTDDRYIQIIFEDMTLSAEFILGTFTIGELASIGNDVNNQSKNFLLLLIKMIGEGIANPNPGSTNKAKDLQKALNTLNNIINVTSYTGLGLDSILSGINQEVTLYLRLDLAPVTGFLVCASGEINAELMKSIIETIFNTTIGNIANGYTKFSKIPITAAINNIAPVYVKNYIDKINKNIDNTNQLVIDKIGESLQRSISIVDEVTGMKVEIKVCMPLTLVSSTPPVEAG